MSTPQVASPLPKKAISPPTPNRRKSSGKNNLTAAVTPEKAIPRGSSSQGKSPSRKTAKVALKSTPKSKERLIKTPRSASRVLGSKSETDLLKKAHVPRRVRSLSPMNKSTEINSSKVQDLKREKFVSPKAKGDSKTVSTKSPVVKQSRTPKRTLLTKNQPPVSEMSKESVIPPVKSPKSPKPIRKKSPKSNKNLEPAVCTPRSTSTPPKRALIPNDEKPSEELEGVKSPRSSASDFKTPVRGRSLTPNKKAITTKKVSQGTNKSPKLITTIDESSPVKKIPVSRKSRSLSPQSKIKSPTPKTKDKSRKSARSKSLSSVIEANISTKDKQGRYLTPAKLDAGSRKRKRSQSPVVNKENTPPPRDISLEMQGN